VQDDAKILRFVNSKDAARKYHPPADNPFAQGGGRGEVFAYGLRNPWRWSFDALTGDLWVGDVGEADSEEVDIVVKGGNYGWKVMEGSLGTNSGSMLLPFFTFDHSNISVNPSGPAIIGGVVFRGNPASKYYGTYFMACYGTKRFWNLKRGPSGQALATVLDPTPTSLSTFGTDADGRLYACGINNGLIYYLDSPDLVPYASLRRGQAPMGSNGRVFYTRAGDHLDPRAFAGARSLELLDLAGIGLGTLRADDARLPPGLARGIYLVRMGQGGAGSGMIMVP